MADELPSHAERAAEAAEGLEAFGGFKLLHVRRQVAQLLSQVGTHGIFAEYTDHSIQHIDRMTDSLDWLLPEATKSIMTSADWLLVTLGIYFHDLGMLVTKDEFDDRANSSFPEFRRSSLEEPSAQSMDLATKLAAMDPDDAERFLYQEFVRKNHATRVQAWINGEIPVALGAASAAGEVLRDLLAPLDADFRRDLGVVCASHHLDDLDNLDKYPTDQPYGPEADATANVQYAAIILRTVDLLDITSKRTPSTMFRVVNPRDPISQAEWAKQQAVKTVRPKIGLDSDGNPSHDAPRDTIEVFATFSNEQGFFGLSSYLEYADGQIAQSNQWARQASESAASRYEFPWKRIDQSKVAAKGFLANKFQFTFDQPKILDLLTGHTLYNDTSVVIREIVQNSIDAVRLEFHGKDGGPAEHGRIDIEWASERGELTVWDNGTGMSQAVIENHFLKVGSSRYQDPQFKEDHPDFSPISRFGIGVLSAFMVADAVEIVTFSPEESEGRRLLLRDVHGRYLIEFVKPDEDLDAQRLGSHGTMVRLRLRPSAQLKNVLDTCRQWFVVPGVPLTVTVDDSEAVRVGADSVGDAVRAILGSAANSPRVEIVESELDGTSLAYVVALDQWFDEWRFQEFADDDRRDGRASVLCNCIEGIRVEDGSPGFAGSVVLAVANSTGPSAPKTNVARSGLEGSEGAGSVYRRLYSMYLDHLSRERERSAAAGRSVTWFGEEVGFILRTLWSPANPYQRREGVRLRAADEMQGVLRQAPLFLVEVDGRRSVMSVNELEGLGGYWTVSSEFFRHATWLAKEVQGEVSYRGITESIASDQMALPSGAILCTGASVLPYSYLLDGFEPAAMKAVVAQRRLDVQWSAADGRWTNPPRLRDFAIADWFQSFARRTGFDPDNAQLVHIPARNVDVEGLSDFSGVVVGSTIYLLPDRGISSLFERLFREGLHPRSTEALVAFGLTATHLGTRRDRQAEWISEVCDVAAQVAPPSAVDWQEFASVLKAESRAFDIRAWQRQEAEDGSWRSMLGELGGP